MRTGTLISAAILIGSAVATGAAAQDETGKALYVNACAVCHGATGIGDGPMAEVLNVQIPNLQQLSQKNDGVFPMLDVIHIIDGRTGVRSHGSEMPFWGNQFKSESVGDAGVYGSEVIVRGKMLSLALYLESIQDE